MLFIYLLKNFKIYNSLIIKGINKHSFLGFVGVTKSYTKYFKEIRNTRLERYSSETNKLLIRLDKLLNHLPNDPVERKGLNRLLFKITLYYNN